jgi:hypothetical protein
MIFVIVKSKQGGKILMNDLINKDHARLVNWMPPLLEVLKEKGGSATSKEVIDGIARRMKLDDKTLSERFEKLGQRRFDNEVYWAKVYLTRENLVCVSKRGVWALTDEGLKTSLNYDGALAIFNKWIKIRTNIPKPDDETPPDLSTFAMEKHLEDFLIANWSQTELGKDYNIFTEDGNIVGQQYKTEIGDIDILGISKDQKTILVVELKKGRTSDVVVGQIQRYMGFVKEELAEPDQNVKGIIIALDDDPKIKYALSVTNNIEFYRYKINFKLFKN